MVDAQGPGRPLVEGYLNAWRPTELQEETHRSRSAAGGDQQGQRAGEIHPARAPVHAAPLVGAAAAGGGTGGDFHANGGRPVGAPDQVVRTVTENCRTLKFKTYGFEEE